jgi:hypothetical protein
MTTLNFRLISGYYFKLNFNDDVDYEEIINKIKGFYFYKIMVDDLFKYGYVDSVYNSADEIHNIDDLEKTFIRAQKSTAYEYINSKHQEARKNGLKHCILSKKEKEFLLCDMSLLINNKIVNFLTEFKDNDEITLIFTKITYKRFTKIFDYVYEKTGRMICDKKQEIYEY